MSTVEELISHVADLRDLADLEHWTENVREPAVELLRSEPARRLRDTNMR